MKKNIKKISSKVKTGDNRRGTPKMFATVKFWGMRLAGLVFILLPCLSISSASALTYGNNINLEYHVNTTLDVSFSSNTGFIIEDLAPGTSSYSNTVTITASSNNSDGFTLSATAGDAEDEDRNNNKLVYNNGTTNYYFDSVATNANVTLGNLGANAWGYATYDSTNSVWSNYNGLPAVGTAGNPTIGSTLLETNSAGTANLDMRIGASSTNTQVAGEFTNNINFKVTARIVTYDYTITYLPNNPSSTGTVTNMPSNVTLSDEDYLPITTGDTVIVDEASTIPVLSNYVFAGWCDSTVTGNVCSGRTYYAGDYLKITNPLVSDNTNSTVNNVTLTAMWKPYMQNIADWKDAMLAETHYEVKAIDSRDNTEYWVTKLLDNHIWMTQNLDFDLDENTTLTSNDTDLTFYGSKGYDSNNGYACSNTETTTNCTANGEIISWIPERSTIAPDAIENWRRTDNRPYSYDAGKNVVKDGSNSYDGHFYTGNYYNWSAAIASNNSSSFSSSTFDDITNNPQNSVCPKGWRLPTIANNDVFPGTVEGSVNEFRRLNVLYNGNLTNNANALMQAPLYFNRSGYVYGGSVDVAGRYAYYWSSTVSGGNVAYYLYFGSSYVNPENYSNRLYGFSVRCVAE